MIKATVKTGESIETKFFDTIGHAIQWVRSFAGKDMSWQVFGTDGSLYYAC